MKGWCMELTILHGPEAHDLRLLEQKSIGHGHKIYDEYLCTEG